MIILYLILWYLSGALPTYWYVHTVSDIKRSDLIVIFACAGLVGPIAGFLVGAAALLLGIGDGDVIIPKRRRP